MNMYKQRGAFVLEWSMALPFYIFCTIFLIVICLWMSSISFSMFYLNESARFASREVFNPEATVYKQSPEAVFDEKMKDFVKSPPLMVDEASYSINFYNDLNDALSGNSQSYDATKTKIVSYSLNAKLNPLISVIPGAMNFKTRLFYSLHGDEDTGILIK